MAGKHLRPINAKTQRRRPRRLRKTTLSCDWMTFTYGRHSEAAQETPRTDRRIVASAKTTKKQRAA